jgi:hypothetical protein
MMVILFMSGVQLVCWGIIGEYLMRISNRPAYIVAETNTEKQMSI